MKLVNKDLSINLIDFEYDGSVWSVVGTERKSNGMMNCIDEIRCKKNGDRIYFNRIELFNLQNEGKIKPYNKRSTADALPSTKKEKESITTNNIDQLGLQL